MVLSRSHKHGIALAIGFLLLAAGGVGVYTYYKKAGDHKTHQPHAPIVVAAAVRKDMPIWLDAVGTVQADTTITVKTQVTGQVIDEPFKEGALVKKGDVLAHIDPRPYQAALDEAMANMAKDKAQLDNARVDLKRYVNLGDAVSNQTLETQRTLVKQLDDTVAADQGAIDNAVTQLSYTTIRAPVDGIAGIQQVNPGSIAQISDANGIVLLTTIEPMDVVFSLPQQDIPELSEQIGRQTQNLSVQALDSDNQTILDRGYLDALDNQVNSATGSVLLKAIVPNKAHKLWPGSFVNARLLLKTKTASLTVPTVAIQHGPDGAFVFVYDPEDKTVHMQNVKTAESVDLDTIITGGLDDGDQVAVEGMAKLEDKTKVTIAPAIGSAPAGGQQDNEQ